MKAKAFIIFPFVFTIVGLSFIVVGILLQFSNAAFLKDAQETYAVITEIETYRDSDGDTRHRVYVEYSVDDQSYQGSLGEWHSGMKVGGKTKVYYNPEDPSDYRGGSSGFMGIIIIAFGSIFFLIGVGISLAMILKKRKNISSKNPADVMEYEPRQIRDRLQD